MNQSEAYGCLVPGCDDPHHARGLCGAHFQAWRRTGAGTSWLPLAPTQSSLR
jgi:hypothetical protein